MMHIKSYLLLLLIFILSIPAAYAQTGTIKGTVIDREDREPLIGVNIIIRGYIFRDRDQFRRGSTKSANIRAGEYSVGSSDISDMNPCSLPAFVWTPMRMLSLTWR